MRLVAYTFHAWTSRRPARRAAIRDRQGRQEEGRRHEGHTRGSRVPCTRVTSPGTWMRAVTRSRWCGLEWKPVQTTDSDQQPTPHPPRLLRRHFRMRQCFRQLRTKPPRMQSKCALGWIDGATRWIQTHQALQIRSTQTHRAARNQSQAGPDADRRGAAGV